MSLPPGSLVLVRHARAAGQAPDAPLTPEGQVQAGKLAEELAAVGITRIVSSPWLRAVDTIAPTAQTLDLPVLTDDRLTERVLSPRDLSFWRTALKVSFRLPWFALPGGESGTQAWTRARAAVEQARDPAGVTVIVTHGNLLALLLGLDFDGWAALRNPDVRVWPPGEAPRRAETT